MSTRRSVFISYKHVEPDAGLARALADTLTAANHKVFIDTGIRWGHSWVVEIEQALKSCDYLLLLLSQEAAQSEMVIEEVAIAKELAKQSRASPRGRGLCLLLTLHNLQRLSSLQTCKPVHSRLSSPNRL